MFKNILVGICAVLLSAQSVFAGGQGVSPEKTENSGKWGLVYELLEKEFRFHNGQNNHSDEKGMAGIPFMRLGAPSYGDGSRTPAGEDRPSPREISNAVFAQEHSHPSPFNHSSFLRQWGQFLDHDITLSTLASPAEYFPITVPLGDSRFDPYNQGNKIIPLERSHYTMQEGVRQQMNAITSFIDASMVYGSDEAYAKLLRTNDGTGKMRISYSNNGEVLMDTGNDGFFLGGDIRANEQVGLIAMHTLFVREHNYRVEKIAKKFPELSGDDLYALARDIVTAEIQAITVNEYLPIVLGKRDLPEYQGYTPGIDPSISNEFATAAFRFGHTQLPSTIQRVDKHGNEAPEGHLDLAEAFFHPDHVKEYGVDTILRGLFYQHAESIDALVINDVRNMLFGPPGAGGLDLVSLNIQRGRDHGLPSFNDMREALGLKRYTNFKQITKDEEVAGKLASMYNSVDDIDLRVGGLAEQPIKGGLLGQTFTKILKNQFRRLRNGDRFRYENRYSEEVVTFINNQTLNTIIERNSTIKKNEMPKSVFYVKK